MSQSIGGEADATRRNDLGNEIWRRYIERPGMIRSGDLGRIGRRTETFLQGLNGEAAMTTSPLSFLQLPSDAGHEPGPYWPGIIVVSGQSVSARLESPAAPVPRQKSQPSAMPPRSARPGHRDAARQSVAPVAGASGRTAQAGIVQRTIVRPQGQPQSAAAVAAARGTLAQPQGSIVAFASQASRASSKPPRKIPADHATGLPASRTGVLDVPATTPRDSNASVSAERLGGGASIARAMPTVVRETFVRNHESRDNGAKMARLTAGRPVVQRIPDPSGDWPNLSPLPQETSLFQPAEADAWPDDRGHRRYVADPDIADAGAHLFAASPTDAAARLPYLPKRAVAHSIVQRKADLSKGSARNALQRAVPQSVSATSSATVQRQSDGTSASVQEQAEEKGVDLDQLANKVWLRVVRRLSVETERRGWKRWH